MARKPVVKSVETNTVPVENNETEMLKKQVAELTSMIQSLMKNNKSQEMVVEDEKVEKVALDDYIRVMSLCPNVLNLATKPRGQGSMFTFKKFGEVKTILYKDLVELVENNRTFIEEGRVYIMNKKVIRTLGLDEAYQNILEKGKLEEIFETSSRDVVDLFKSANDKQKQFICEMLIAKLRDGIELDLNIVDQISRLSGIEINKIAKEAKDYMDAVK